MAVNLREDALALIGSAGLLDVLQARFGAAALVGSADFDLMSWRDIDIYSSVERGEKSRFIDALGEMHGGLDAAGLTLVRATFNDEWALPRGDYGSGYYWGLRVRNAAGESWKIDLWGWAATDYRRKLDENAKLKAALESADRTLILKLKSEAMALPGFRKTVTSWDIYRFVLGGHGTSLDELRSFCGG